MVNLKYVSSNGIEFDLHDFSQAKLLKADFHDVDWSPEVITKQYGTVVNRFTKNPQQFSCTFRFKGDPSARKAQIYSFIFQTENDIAKLEPGRLYWNEQYIDVYFKSHDCYPVDSGMNWTELKGTYYAPFPFWIEEKSYWINPESPLYPEEGLPKDVKGYPLKRGKVYAYTYSYPYGINSGTYYVDSPIGADFRVYVKGPITGFKMEVAGNNYQINHALLTGEWMVIDSRDTLPLDKKCFIIRQNLDEDNVFDYRDPTSSIFKRLPGGDIVITCNQPYVMYITLFCERSAPI